MATRKLTQQELDYVAGLPSREAAEKLTAKLGFPVGKSTVNDARAYARENGGKLPNTNGNVDVKITGSAVPTTKEEITASLAERGITEDDYTITYRYSVFDQGDNTKNAFKATAVPKRVLVPDISAEPEESVDPFEILAKVRATNVADPSPEWAELHWGVEESAFCLSINDIQLGQSFNGGSAATIEQFHRFVGLAVERINELRKAGRNLTKLVIVFGGDLVEGCTIYPNMSYSLDMDRKTQIEGVIALGLYAIDTLSPTFDTVQVLATRGNHGEHRINGNKTTLYDNDDTHTVDMMRLAYSRDPDHQNIEWYIAGSEAAVGMEVYNWVLVTTHGDIYAKNVAGASVDKKAQNWYKNMAAGREEKFGLLARPDIIVGHHFHHEKSSDWGACRWIQTPSQDRGSEYFEQSTGEYSEPGMLTWTMSPSSRWKDEQVLR